MRIRIRRSQDRSAKAGDLRALELHHIASGAHANLKQRASAGNHVRFAGELAWTVAHHQLLVDPFTPNDVELTVDDDETRDIWVACLDKDLAGFDLSAAAMRRDSSDLIAGELPETADPCDRSMAIVGLATNSQSSKGLLV
jgi:hypothetical protein